MSQGHQGLSNNHDNGCVISVLVQVQVTKQTWNRSPCARLGAGSAEGSGAQTWFQWEKRLLRSREGDRRYDEAQSRVKGSVQVGWPGMAELRTGHLHLDPKAVDTPCGHLGAMSRQKRLQVQRPWAGRGCGTCEDE